VPHSHPGHIQYCEEEKRKRPRKLIDTLMTFVGVVASVSSIPQIIKIWQTGNVEGIAISSYIIALVAIVCWFFYGMYLKNKPLIITSILSALILGTVVVQILTYM